MGKKPKKSELLRGFKKVDTFLGVERWVKGKRYKIYSLKTKEIIHTFTQ